MAGHWNWGFNAPPAQLLRDPLLSFVLVIPELLIQFPIIYCTGIIEISSKELEHD
jgi:hypothetical protein